MNSHSGFIKLFLFLVFFFFFTSGSSPGDYLITSLPFYKGDLPYEMYAGFLPIDIIDASALSMDEQLNGK